MDNYNKGDNNKPRIPGAKGPKMPFNLYWIYLIVFAAIVGMYFFTENNGGIQKEIAWSEFQSCTGQQCK